MMAHDSTELLRRYIRDRSETAFRGLVELHSPLVYATALRRLSGDRAAAQDVTQEVFTLLARKASALQGLQLGGWLYRQTCRRAANHARAESRRRAREAVAAMASADDTGAGVDYPELGGEVDEAMLSLPGADRDALVLRYFEARDFRNVGSLLGISEEAARKRVNRALEKLCALLKRRGIAVGSATLGTSMSGMAATPVPAGLVSTVTSHALKSASLAGSFTLWPLAKALLAGLLFSSVLAGVGLLVRAPDRSRASAQSPPTGSAGEDPRSHLLRDFPENSSLEALIAEIQRVRSGPGNSLTSLRVNALLERVSNEQIPEFVALGNRKLSAADRKVAYPRLLDRWAKTATQAALDFVLEQDLDKQANPDRSSSLLNKLHHDLARQNPNAAIAWLLQHWDHPLLVEDAFYGKWRTFMSANLAEELLSHGGVATSMDFIRSIPTAADRHEVLQALCGNSTWHEDFITAPAGQVVEFHHALMALPEEELRRELIPRFWGKVAEDRPEEVAKLVEGLEPKDRFQVQLGLLRVTQKPADHEPLMDGGNQVESVTAGDRQAREKAAMDAGLAAGFTQEEAIAEILPVMMGVLPGQARFDWLDANRGDSNVDAWLAEKARRIIRDNNEAQGEAPHVEAIGWASRISDPALRLRLCRAAFRRCLLPNKSSAEIYLERDTFPPDLTAEFRKILGETP